MKPNRLTSTGRGPYGRALGRSLVPMDARDGGPLHVIRPFLSADDKKAALAAAEHEAAQERLRKVKAKEDARRRLEALKRERAAEMAVKADPVKNASQIPAAFPRVTIVVGFVAAAVAVYVGVRLLKKG